MSNKDKTYCDHCGEDLSGPSGEPRPCRAYTTLPFDVASARLGESGIVCGSCDAKLLEQARGTRFTSQRDLGNWHPNYIPSPPPSVLLCLDCGRASYEHARRPRDPEDLVQLCDGRWWHITAHLPMPLHPEDERTVIVYGTKVKGLARNEGDGECLFGTTDIFGTRCYIHFIRVQRDEENVQQPVDDPNGRFTDLLKIDGEITFQEVEVPGFEGNYVFFAYVASE